MKSLPFVILFVGLILQTASAQWTASEPVLGSTLATATSGYDQENSDFARVQFICNYMGENVRFWIDNDFLPWGAHDLHAHIWTLEDTTPGEPMAVRMMQQGDHALFYFSGREVAIRHQYIGTAVLPLTTSDYLRLDVKDGQGVQHTIPFSLIGANSAIDHAREYCIQ